MELREGYKNTEVGVLPEDWDVKPLLECCSKITDGTHDTPKPVETGIPFLTAIHVKENNIDYQSCYYLPESVHRIIFNRCNPEKNDVLMVNIGAGVATTALVNVDYEFSLKNVALLKPELSKLVGAFLNYWQIYSKSRIISSISTGGAQPFLSLNQIGNLKIAMPTKAEQTAIATALSDADALINSLEKLIAKKRNIKQGAMQQLLKPKEGWEHKSLGEIGLISGAGVDKLINEDEVPVRLVNYMDVFKRDFIYSNELNHWVTAPQHKAIKCAVKQGDVFFTPSSEMRYDIAVSAVAMEDIPNAVYSYHLVRLRLSEDWDLNFRTYIFKTRYFLGQAEQVCEGSGKRYVITLPKFRSLKVYYPKTKEEQNEIATILSDMDAEIQALETKLEKYRKIKLGMMQNLLTGKIRLV